MLCDVFGFNLVVARERTIPRYVQASAMERRRESRIIQRVSANADRSRISGMNAIRLLLEVIPFLFLSLCGSDRSKCARLSVFVQHVPMSRPFRHNEWSSVSILA